MVVPTRPFSLAHPSALTTDARTPVFREAEIALTGSSPAITQLMGQMTRVAPYFRTALLTGERGCGEEAAARLLHRLSPLADRAFFCLSPAEAEARFGDGTVPEAATTEGMLYLPSRSVFPRRPREPCSDYCESADPTRPALSPLPSGVCALWSAWAPSPRNWPTP